MNVRPPAIAEVHIEIANVSMENLAITAVPERSPKRVHVMKQHVKCGQNGLNMANVRSPAPMGQNDALGHATVMLESVKESAKKTTIVLRVHVRPGPSGPIGAHVPKRVEAGAM